MAIAIIAAIKKGLNNKESNRCFIVWLVEPKLSKKVTNFNSIYSTKLYKK